MLLKNSFFTFLLCLLSSINFAQTNISGVINQYTAVTAVDYPNNAVTVAYSAAFSVGDQVLLLQTQGATINETDAAMFGSITSYGDAGNYEILIICDIVGNVVTFDAVLLNTYTATGSVQLITMPRYTDATISGGDLTANAWDGTTGGVLVFEVSGTLDFGTQNIDVRDLGFRGGASINADGSCNFILDATYYQAAGNASARAFKGEGITAFIVNKEAGRGPQANGGGGGNNHNGGGGGGANYGLGGRGGQRIKRSTFTCGSEIGVSSKSLASGYGVNKIFLGGGGGAGQGNNAITIYGTGENGAGLVIIRATTVTANGQSILADGSTVPGNADSDGGGAGGAGGTVLLDVTTFSNVLNVSVTGGNGASIDNFGTSNCNGPGGGGGGGVVWTSGGTTPTNLNATLTAGLNGITAVTGQTNCTVGSANSALPGALGSELQSLTLNESNTTYAGCLLLPIQLHEFSGKYDVNFGVLLNWSTLSENNNDYFTIKRSSNGSDYAHLATVNGKGNSTTQHHYYTLDPSPETGMNYYRLSQTDFDGHDVYLGTVALNVQREFEGLIIAPNPVYGITEVQFTNSSATEVSVQIFKISGEQVYQEYFMAQVGENKVHFDATALSSGIYYLIVSGEKQAKRVKFVK
ncbi:MAG: hypothetical protein ACI865_001738 [Flavobacteriaceae bacterium]|jgi:hypothetical protein